MKKYTQNDRIPFTDDIMFSLVMHDEDICREFLQRILPDTVLSGQHGPGISQGRPRVQRASPLICHIYLHLRLHRRRQSRLLL